MNKQKFATSMSTYGENPYKGFRTLIGMYPKGEEQIFWVHDNCQTFLATQFWTRTWPRALLRRVMDLWHAIPFLSAFLGAIRKSMWRSCALRSVTGGCGRVRKCQDGWCQLWSVTSGSTDTTIRLTGLPYAIRGPKSNWSSISSNWLVSRK